MLQLLPICEEESENSTRYNCLNYLMIPGWFSIKYGQQFSHSFTGRAA
jgi:hypothetical protein